MISDYMQEIVENIPDQTENSDPPGEDHEGLDAINAVWVVAIITTNNVTFRAFHTGLISSGFFPDGFHDNRWEGPL
jgi:hypothetical protein